MAPWNCAIRGCGRGFGSVEDVLSHQVRDHARHECRVCGTVVPEGFYAIQHLFEEHSRADYVRHYEGDADDIRAREAVKSDVESLTDPEAVLRRATDADADSHPEPLAEAND